jgi:hypothetical protein
VEQPSSWDTLVKAICNFPADDQVYTAIFDPNAASLSATDMSSSVPCLHAQLMDMIAHGVLKEGLSELGEPIVSINHSKLIWRSTLTSERGGVNPVGHVSREQPLQLTKLELLMCMHADGWRPTQDPQVVCHGLDKTKVYHFSLKAGKAYYAALLVADRVLARMPCSAERVPLIYHKMPDKYYRGLLTLPTHALEPLLALADATYKRATDAAFAQLLSDDIGAEDEEEDENELRAPPAVLALDDVEPDQRDIASISRIALQVLRAIPAEMVDISSSAIVRAGQAHVIRVHFDNCSHASGKQRAYVACGVPHHVACFRYGVLEQWPSRAHAAAFLAAWVMRGLYAGPGFSKEDHKKFVPTEAQVNAMMRHVELA